MRFNEEELQRLSNNPNVLYVTSSSIHYTSDFKSKAIREYELGKSAREIFTEAGFDLSQISKHSDYASKMLSKWRKENCNNTSNIHYPKKKGKVKLTDYQKMAARLEYLEAENEFLKKLSALCDEYGA